MSSKKSPDPNLSVFINVPFDPEYEPMMRAIVFAVYDCGFVARSAAEIIGHTRLRKICDLIGQSQLGIADLSRVGLYGTGKNKLPRFNMPFELGIFLGISRLGSDHHLEKSCLILEEKPYRYQICLSDIAGLDISVHKNDPRKVITIVRDWLEQYTDASIPGGDKIWSDYQKFSAKLPDLCIKLGFPLNNLIYRNYVELVSAWLKAISPPPPKKTVKKTAKPVRRSAR